MNKARMAVEWILGGTKTDRRTQAQAALKFDVDQSVVSRALKTWRMQNPRKPAPDGRRKTWN